MVEKAKKAITKKIETVKHVWVYPHIRAIALTIVILIVSGVLSVVLFDCCGAISAIMASICAGCVTGIVFYVITNIRNNEIQATKEEYEEVENNFQLARNIINLCSDTIVNFPYPEKNIKDICLATKRILIYVGTLCFGAPKTTQIIVDFPSMYNELLEQTTDAINTQEKTEADGYTDYSARSRPLIRFFRSTQSAQ